MSLSKETTLFRKKNGLCSRCGQPAIPNQTLCKSCKEKRPYYRRKAQGLCPKCGSKLPPGKVFCNECLQNAKKEQDWYRQHGICIMCRSNDAMIGKTLCPECDEKNLERCKKYAEALPPEKKKLQKERVRKWRAARVEKGLCVVCGKPNHDKRFKLCPRCRAYHRQLKQGDAKNYAQIGKCRRCGGDLVEGYAFCEKHLEDARQLAEHNFRPFGKPIADHSYWKQLNNALFTK